MLGLRIRYLMKKLGLDKNLITKNVYRIGDWNGLVKRKKWKGVLSLVNNEPSR